MNTLVKDTEVDDFLEKVKFLYLEGVDALIMQDLGMICLVRQMYPDLEIHASTQFNNSSKDTLILLKKLGVKRAVLSRELSIDEIKMMDVDIEKEIFIHGALCVSYSGCCLFSSMIGHRSGNRGECTGCCRLPYKLETNGKIVNSGYLLSMKELNTTKRIKELLNSGVCSLKIEGRMKQPEYVYTVVKMYRKYADHYLKLQKEGKDRSAYRVSEADKRELLAAYQRRGYCEGYYHQHNGRDMISLKRPKNAKDGNTEEKPWQDIKVQEKINGILTFSVGKRAKLTVSYGNITVECTGQEVQEAQKQPLDPKRIEKQMRKTGNTEFVFERLKIHTEGNVFLPMQALNELRREGIKELTEKIQMQYRREEADCETETKKTVEKNSTGKECSISASVQSKAQLEAAVNSGVRCVYLDEEIEFERENGVQYFLAMPYIFRERTIRRYERMYAKIEGKYDGILIRNWESYAWLRQHAYQKEIRSDYNLYIFNQKAKEELKNLGIGQGTAPVELNDREMAELGIGEQAFIAYGYQPVMVSASCIKKTSASCDGKGGVLTISDRYQKEFTVRCYCRDCYNVMYNSAPLFLADKAEEIRKLMPAQIRLDFTVENKEQVREICKIYMNAFTEGKKMEPQIREYTRGHFKRGVK